MENIYKELNHYLNIICNYLEDNYPFLLENIEQIQHANNHLLDIIDGISFNKVIPNNDYTFEEVFNIARDIIESIDHSYLVEFDELIKNGELNFNYEETDEDSNSTIEVKENGDSRRLINVNRRFNCRDIILLVHEFIHYKNGEFPTQNRMYFTEFLSIYFEFYGIDYLSEKNIMNETFLLYEERIKILANHSKFFYQYGIVLLAFIKFGDIDKNTYSLLKEYYPEYSEDTFEKHLKLFYIYLNIAEDVNKDSISKEPSLKAYFVTMEFVGRNYLYIMGTLLAIYAHKYCNIKDIIYLNNHLQDYSDKTVFDICKMIGIDLKSRETYSKLWDAVNEILSQIQINSDKIII